MNSSSPVATQSKTVQIGSIFVCSWGYDQTNIDWYVVTKMVGKSSVSVVRVHGNKTYTDAMCGTSLPVVSAWNGTPTTKRLSGAEDGHPCFRVNSYSTAFLWDGRRETFTEGH